MTGDKQDRDVEGQASHHSSGPPGLSHYRLPPRAIMTVVDMLRELRQAAAALEQHLADERPRRRLRRSVIRPLDQALAQLTGQAGAAAIDPDPAPSSDAAAGVSAADSVLEVPRRATRLRVEHDDGLPLEVLEAAAGLRIWP